MLQLFPALPIACPLLLVLIFVFLVLLSRMSVEELDAQSRGDAIRFASWPRSNTLWGDFQKACCK